jgi:hypothetical protein
MENGWASRQVRQEDAARNRTFRLSEMPQTIQRSTEQEEDLGLIKSCQLRMSDNHIEEL